jgi:hypothetical protein
VERVEACAVLNQLRASSNALALSSSKKRFYGTVYFYLYNLNPSQDNVRKLRSTGNWLTV